MPRIESKLGRIVVSILTALYLLLSFYVVVKPGWKEYKGDGFSLKYPQRWIIQISEKPRFPYEDGREYLLEISDKSALPESNRNQPSFSYPGNSLVFILRFPKETVGPNATEKLAENLFTEFNSTKEGSTKIYLIGDKKTILVTYFKPAFSTFNRDYFIDSKNFVYDISLSTFLRENKSRFLLFDLVGQNIVNSIRVSDE